MSKLLNISIGLYVLFGVTFVILGFDLVTTPEYKFYHAAATQMPWDQLDKGFQGLFLGFLKAGGAGDISMGITIILLALIPLRQKISWAFWLVPLLAIIYDSLLTYAVYTVYTMTPASPPIYSLFVLGGLVIIAAILSFAYIKSDSE